MAALFLGAGGYLHLRDLRGTERSLAELRAVTLADAVTRSLGESMRENRSQNVLAIIDSVGRTQGVRGLALAGPDGEILRKSGKSPDRLAVPDEGSGPSWSSDHLSLVKEIRSKGHNGILYLALDVADIEERLSRAGWRMVLGMGTALLCITLAILLSLRAFVSRPLGRLRSFADALGRGEFSARPPKAPKAEVQSLTVALCTMAAEIQRSHEVLEKRVEERTSRLADALAGANAAQAQRSAALARLQAIVDSMADGVIFVDAEDRIALINQAGRVLRNLNDDPDRPVKDCHPPHVHTMLERVLGYFRSGDNTGPAHPIIKEREGRFETTYAPVRAPDGGYLGIVMVIRDIAERKILEKRLLDAERLAGLGQMSAQVAHELRNPLNAIAGSVQYLRKVLPDVEEVAEYGELIEQEVRRVNRFVNDLLRVARPAEPVLAAADVNEIGREAARRAAVAQGADKAVQLDLQEDLPRLELDAPQIMQALVNLLDNAFEAGGPDPPTLLTRLSASGNTVAVVVEVLDRGCGIPPNQIDEVSRPFVTTKATGTGLGLVIVTRAVEQHRADFTLSARPGGGTIAAIHFPLRTARSQESGNSAPFPFSLRDVNSSPSRPVESGSKV